MQTDYNYFTVQPQYLKSVGKRKNVRDIEVSNYLGFDKIKNI